MEDLTLSENDLINALAEGMIEGYKSYDIPCEYDETVNNIDIAGETYKNIALNINNAGFVQDIYLRKIDGYMVYICITANNVGESSEIVNAITSVE